MLGMCWISVGYMSNRCWIDVEYIQSRIDVEHWNYVYHRWWQVTRRPKQVRNPKFAEIVRLFWFIILIYDVFLWYSLFALNMGYRSLKYHCERPCNQPTSIKIIPSKAPDQFLLTVIRYGKSICMDMSYYILVAIISYDIIRYPFTYIYIYSYNI